MNDPNAIVEAINKNTEALECIWRSFGFLNLWVFFILIFKDCKSVVKYKSKEGKDSQ